MESSQRWRQKNITLDSKTFLRTLGAAAGGDFSAQSIDALRDLSREKLTAAAESMKAAAMRAADFLATEISAPRAESIPYSNQFAVLCEVFRIIPTPSDTQLTEIKRWFWRTTLSGYFGGWDSGQMTQDTKKIRAFADGSSASLGDGGIVPTASLWSLKPFRSNSAVSKMLGLMLAEGTPLDLVNGQKIDVDKSLAWSNDKEYHHFFPQAYLARSGITATQANVVGNIVLLTSISNIQIKDKAPSQYLREIMSASGRGALVQRMASNLVPEVALDAALDDDYQAFLTMRSEFLHRHAASLTGQRRIAEKEESPELIDDVNDDTTG